MMTLPPTITLNQRILAVALAAIFGFAAVGFAANEPSELVQTGKIIKINAEQLQILEMTDTHEFALNETVKVTLDGKPIRALQLKPGMLAKVSYLLDGDRKIAVVVDAATVRP